MVEKSDATRDLTIRRVFNSQRDVVFKAWTDPAYLALWWGPRGFTNPVCEVDARPGGRIRIHMRGPDGTIYPMIGTYQEVVKPERLVFTSQALNDEDEPMFEILNIVTFEKDDDKTVVTVHARVISKTAAADMYLDGMEEGWSQSLDRLAPVVQRV